MGYEDNVIILVLGDIVRHCQQLDVVIYKSLKSCVTNICMEWLVEEGLQIEVATVQS